MPASRETISEWFDVGVAQGATHLIVVRETFGNTDFPHYVMPGQDHRRARDRFDSSEGMSEVVEVYDLQADKMAHLAMEVALLFGPH